MSVKPKPLEIRSSSKDTFEPRNSINKAEDTRKQRSKEEDQAPLPANQEGSPTLSNGTVGHVATSSPYIINKRQDELDFNEDQLSNTAFGSPRETTDHKNKAVNRIKVEERTKRRGSLANDESADDEEILFEEDEEEELDGSELSEELKQAKMKLKKERERLKKEEERLRRESTALKKRLKEDHYKKEKERTKKEKEETERKMKDLKREAQRLYRMTNDSYKDMDDMYAGWVKMRSPLKNWHLRYFVLRPGKLIYYKDEYDKHCMGIILLGSCEVAIRKSKKDGYCFKISHPREANIYSTKGLKGEALASGMVPISADHCILRVNSEEDRTNWIQKIAEAIEMCKGKNADRQTETDESSSFITNDREDTPLSPNQSNQVISLDAHNQEKNQQIESYLQSHIKTVQKTKTNQIKKTTYSEPEINDDNFEDGPKEEKLESDSTSLIFMLLKQLKPGMDLSRVVLPTFILEPRSMLEKLSDFLTHVELLSLVPKMDDPLQRMIAIVKWYVSGYYIRPKGVKKPYNPILGETYRCMYTHPDDSKTYFVSEQVSHHPPISAFYTSNRKAGFVINGSILFRSKFLGTSAASILDGFATIYLINQQEEYEMTFPSAHAKGFLFGTLLMEFVGPVRILCRKTGIIAELEFKAKPVIGGENNIILAKIKKGAETLYTIRGKWDGLVEIKNATTKETQTLWEPTPEARSNKIPKQKPIESELKDTESEKLWSKVTDAILRGDQNAATEQKAILEQAQRDAAKRRQSLGIVYNPRLFVKDDNGVWVYKGLDIAPYNPEEEIEEYEYNGLIRTRHKNEESESEDSEDEEDDTNQQRSVLDSSPTVVPEVNGIRTHSVQLGQSSTEVKVDDKWRKKVESRLATIEKSFVNIQQQQRLMQQQKSGTNNKKNIYLLLIVAIVFYLLGKSI